MRFAGALRRRGASIHELERRLLAENARRCKPPLPDAEVHQIAASAARYAVGGPDPLEMAWRRVVTENHGSTYSKVLALARHLQLARPGQTIALPLERIAELMGCRWELVRRYRNRAVAHELIRQVRSAIPKRMAALFIVVDPDRTGVPLDRCTTNSPTSS
jgi:hypothetical protein